MSASTIAMAALLVLTAAAVVGPVGSFFRSLSAEQSALGEFAERLAGAQHELTSF